LYINFVGLRKQLPDGSNNWNGSGTFYFLNHYTSLLKTPAKVAISSGSSPTNTYVNNKKTCYRGKNIQMMLSGCIELYFC